VIRKLTVFGVAAVLFLVVFSPVVYSEESGHQESVVVKASRVGVNGVVETLTEMSYDDACKLREFLIELNNAIERGDLQTIKEYESQLNEMGLFGNVYQKIPLKGVSAADAGDNISNSLCYFHAAGRGTILFTLGVKMVEFITNAVKNASSFIEGLAIIIVLLALFAPFLLVTYLVPFRIMMPVGVINMESGSISSFGLDGHKKVFVDESNPLSVTVRGFSGITISIPSGQNNESNGFLFVSGFSLSVEESDF